MFDSVQVDLQGVLLLEQAGRDALINFANSGIGYIDYDSYLAEVHLGIYFLRFDRVRIFCNVFFPISAE